MQAVFAPDHLQLALQVNDQRRGYSILAQSHDLIVANAQHLESPASPGNFFCTSEGALQSTVHWPSSYGSSPLAKDPSLAVQNDSSIVPALPSNSLVFAASISSRYHSITLCAVIESVLLTSTTLLTTTRIACASVKHFLYSTVPLTVGRRDSVIWMPRLITFLQMET